MALFSSQHHTFDIAIASKFGVECAILIHHFQHWIRINQFKKQNIRDGRCWTFQTRKDIQAHFPYWSFEEVKYLTEKLVEKGVLITNNYNKNPIDKTLWYAFVDEKLFGVDAENSKSFYERENSPSIGKIPSPIPDTKTHIHIHNKNNKSYAASPLADFLLLKIRTVNPKFTKEVSPKWIADFQKLLKLRSQQDLRKIIEWVFDGSFWDTVVLSPGNLLKNLDKIEMQINKKYSRKGVSKEWIDNLKERLKNHREISISEDSFCFSSGQSHMVIKFSEPGYKDQILSRLRKMNISIEGL